MSVALSVEEIQNYMNRTRLPAPKEIYFISRGQIGEGVGPYTGRNALGIHRRGANQIVLTLLSNSRTLMHETTHNMGIVGETLTRTVAALANIRAKYRIMSPLRILSRAPRYEQQPMTAADYEMLREDYRIAGNLEDAGVVKLVLMA